MWNRLSECLAYGTVCFASASHAQTLRLGDPAPAIEVGEWIKGDGVESFEKGHVYVVEFWATWCGPCITSIPHLSELQTKHKDDKVHIIGATRPDPNNSREAVGRFVEEQGEKMSYHVAWDADGSIYDSYMVGAEQGGIPTAFIVDREGRLAWLGHPMAMDRPLAMIAAGVWDAKKYREGSDILSRGQESLQRGDLDEAMAGAQKLIDEYPELFGGDAHYLKLSVHWNKGEGEAVIGELDTLIDDYPEHLGDRGPFLKFSTLLQYGMADRAMKLGRELVEGRYHDNPEMLAQMAWGIATMPIDGLDLNLALDAAQRANELRDGIHADTLDTLARVHFMRGDLDRAIELQEQAVKLETDPQRRPHFQRTLVEYRTAKEDG